MKGIIFSVGAAMLAVSFAASYELEYTEGKVFGVAPTSSSGTIESDVIEAAAEITAPEQEPRVIENLGVDPNWLAETQSEYLDANPPTREQLFGFEVIDHESGFFTVKFGESVEGRDMIAHRLVNNPEGTTDLAVYAVTHGTETQMLRWVDYWMTPGYEFPNHISTLWVVPSLNPDGHDWLEKGTVHNANHVNLNRNFGTDWHPGQRDYAAEFGTDAWYSSGHYYSSTSPMDQPESQATALFWAYIGEMDNSIYGHAPWFGCDVDLTVEGLEVAKNFCDTIGYSTSFAARPGTITAHGMATGAGPSWVFEYPEWDVSESKMRFHADQYLMIGSEENPLS